MSEAGTGGRSILVALDNSEHSNACIEVATALAPHLGARCVACHVYAARMHDYRFKQMEYTLPEEYQDEAELLRQRRIHDSLITTGLQLISDSYGDVMRYRCAERGIPFEARHRDGRNWEQLVAEMEEGGHDLLVIGALGMGAVRHSLLGSVTERVLRRLRRDVLVVRRIGEGAMDGDILVGIDGSPQSFGGLRTALEWGRALDKRVEAVAVYDPYLHYAVFNSIVDVLSEKASKVFRFKEQEALHEEIIDTGLAKIYESHLRVAQVTAKEMGVDLEVTLLDGKVFDRLLGYAAERQPWLLVVGRIGVHSDPAMDIGSNTEQLVRLAATNVLVSSASYVPPLDVRAEATTTWTPEAEERLQRVPSAVRGIARTAVLRWCTERGHSVVSSGDVEAALDELMPYQRMMRRVGEVARALAEAERAMVEEPPVADARAVCRRCGYAARAEEPVACPVCGADGDAFERLDSAVLLADAAEEGDASEVAFDGRKLGWTLEARALLHQLPAGYLRRRVKAIIEKTARTRRLPAITRDVVEPIVGPELAALDRGAAPHRAPLGPEAHTGGHVPVAHRIPWTPDAEARLERIPAGFLRNLAAEQVERIALAAGAAVVDQFHVEAGIAEARARMAEASRAATAPTKEPGEAFPARCPAGDPSASSQATDGDGPGTGGDAQAGDRQVAGGEPTEGVLNEVTAAVVEGLGYRLVGIPSQGAPAGVGGHGTKGAADQASPAGVPVVRAPDGEGAATDPPVLATDRPVPPPGARAARSDPDGDSDRWAQRQA